MTGTRREARGAFLAEIPPHDAAIERAVLGLAVLYGESEVLARTRPEHFYLNKNRVIRARLGAMAAAGKGLDVHILGLALKNAGELDEIGGPAYLCQLFEEATVPAHASRYAHELVELWKKRELLALGTRLCAGATNGASVAELSAAVETLLAQQRAEDARQRPDEAPSELTALLAHRFPPRADIVARGLLPREGLLVVGGAPKVGKSLMLDNLCLQRARGRSWLGFPTDPGISLVVQSEVSAEAVQRRFATMLQHDPEPFPEGRLYIKTRRGVLLDAPEGLAQIQGWIEETGADLLRVDPLARHMQGDENSNAAMGAVVRAADHLIERYRIAVVIAHHPSKPSKDEPRSGGLRLRGASALFGAADTVIMLDRTDDGFMLSFDLRHAAAPAQLRLTRTEDLWLVASGPDPDLLAVAAISRDTPLPYRVLLGAAREDLKLSESTGKRRIAAAVAAGLLRKDPDGLYRLGSAYPRSGSGGHEGSADA